MAQTRDNTLKKPSPSMPRWAARLAAYITGSFVISSVCAFVAGLRYGPSAVRPAAQSFLPQPLLSRLSPAQTSFPPAPSWPVVILNKLYLALMLVRLTFVSRIIYLIRAARRHRGGHLRCGHDRSACSICPECGDTQSTHESASTQAAALASRLKFTSLSSPTAALPRPFHSGVGPGRGDGNDAVPQATATTPTVHRKASAQPPARRGLKWPASPRHADNPPVKHVKTFRTHTRHLPLFLLAALLASWTLTAPQAWGQSSRRNKAALPSASPPQPASTPLPGNVTPVDPAAAMPGSLNSLVLAGNNPSPVEFADEPLKLPTIGLSIEVPSGSLTQLDSAGRDSSITVAPKDGAWTMKIKTPRSTDPAASIAQISDIALQLLFDSFGITQQGAREAIATGKLIREPLPGQVLQVAGYDAERWYILLPSLRVGESNVRGYTIIKPSPAQFVVYELLTTPVQYAASRGIFQTVIATTKIQDPALLQATRAAAVTAGVSLLDSIGTTTIGAALDKFPVRWERRYKPASGVGGEQEIAYRRVKFSQGPRSLIQPGKPGTVAAGSGPDGFVVQVDARMLGSQGLIADSRAAYFLSAQRDSEAWSMSNAIRMKAGEKPQLASEVGARDGNSMVVTSEAQGQTSRTSKPVMQGDGYISQVELYLLPQLLMKAANPTEHGFYVWNSGEGKIILRKDRVESVTTDRGEKGWKIASETMEGRKPQIGYYDAEGNMLRLEMPDGSMWEPTTYEDLKRIWESKGLPTN